MSRASDYLRAFGMSEDEITRAHADLDQATAEVDHLIDHAKKVFRSTVEEGLVEGLLIRSHLANKNQDEQHKLLSALVIRAGQLAHTVETLSAENARLAGIK